MFLLQKEEPKKDDAEKKNEGGDKKGGAAPAAAEPKKEEKKADGHPVVVLKLDLHCEGCAKKVRRSIRHVEGNYIIYFL